MGSGFDPPLLRPSGKVSSRVSEPGERIEGSVGLAVGTLQHTLLIDSSARSHCSFGRNDTDAEAHPGQARAHDLFGPGSWDSRPRLFICRPLQGLTLGLIFLFLGLTPQANYLSPLRGSNRFGPRFPQGRFCGAAVPAAHPQSARSVRARRPHHKGQASRLPGGDKPLPYESILFRPEGKIGVRPDPCEPEADRVLFCRGEVYPLPSDRISFLQGG